VKTNYPVINRNLYDFSCISFAAGGEEIAGVVSIDYSQEFKGGAIYGTPAQQVGTTRGQLKVDVSFSVLLEELDRYLAAVCQAGGSSNAGYMETRHNIQVSYQNDSVLSSRAGPLITDVIRGFKIDKLGHPRKAGVDALVVDVEGTALFVIENGRYPLGGTQQNLPNDVPHSMGVTPGPAPVPFWDSPPTPAELDRGPNNDGASAWDVCLLAGVALPGLASVKVKARKRFDVKKKKGSDGARLTFTGYDPADVTVTLRLWTPEHLNQLWHLMPRLKAKAAAKEAQAAAVDLALDINHPALALLSIHSVVIETVGGLEPADVRGSKQMEIHCLEYVPPQNVDVTRTPKGAENFPNAVAINVSKAAAQKPSADASFMGPDGHLAR
jgi:hypothetical protein